MPPITPVSISTYGSCSSCPRLYVLIAFGGATHMQGDLKLRFSAPHDLIQITESLGGNQTVHRAVRCTG
jgi:hypothetical protein